MLRHGGCACVPWHFQEGREMAGVRWCSGAARWLGTGCDFGTAEDALATAERLAQSCVAARLGRFEAFPPCRWLGGGGARDGAPPFREKRWHPRAGWPLVPSRALSWRLGRSRRSGTMHQQRTSSCTGSASRLQRMLLGRSLGAESLSRRWGRPGVVRLSSAARLHCRRVASGSQGCLARGAMCGARS